MDKLAIGVDIGGTNTVFGFVNKEGEILYQNSIKTQTHEKVEDFIKELVSEIDKEKAKFEKEYEIIGMGVGAPNSNFYTGTIEDAANLRWKGKIEFTKIFSRHYKFPMFLTNDANAAAIGEMVFGGAKGMKNFIVVTLGTGLGSGIVVNGELLYGHDGFAGELGHVVVKTKGRKCGCGRKGCLETYVSATGVVRTVYELLASSNVASDLRDIPFNKLDAKSVFEAASLGDEIAIETFKLTGKKLGIALADVIAITSPEAIFLFGGLARAGKILFNQVNSYMEKSVMNTFKNKVTILPSGITDNAAVLGAAAMAWKETEK